MKIAFVIPWYGVDIPGGAEAAARRTAEHLQRAGLPVEVLTTCVRDFHADWGTDFYRPGESVENGVLVRRFPTRKRDRMAFDAVNWKLMHGESISPAEEEVYVRENVNSPALVDFIASHQDGYRYIFIPYMFGTTYWGLAACKGQGYLIPCLHDESYARLGVFHRMMRQARKLLFHVPSELTLARSLYGLPDEALVLVGAGVDTDWTSDGPRFLRQYGIRAPFMLYAGRKDNSKNVGLLLESFRRYRHARGVGIDLVLIGSGPAIERQVTDVGIHDLGFVPLQDKLDAYGAATMLCQPSLMESFSLVLMEAWVAGTPALVHTECAATREHCVNSNGGLYFATYAEFAACLDLLLARPDLRAALGANGRQYVWENYRWDVIIDHYQKLFSTEMGIRTHG